MTGQAEELSTEDVIAEVQSDTVFGEEEMRLPVAVITAESSLGLLLGGRLGVTTVDTGSVTPEIPVVA